MLTDAVPHHKPRTDRIAVSLSEAGEMVGISRKTIDREIQRGEIQCFVVGRRQRRILVTEIERYIQSRMS